MSALRPLLPRLLPALLACLAAVAPLAPLAFLGAAPGPACDAAGCGCTDTSEGCCCAPFLGDDDRAPGDTGLHLESADDCAPRSEQAAAPAPGGPLTHDAEAARHGPASTDGRHEAAPRLAPVGPSRRPPVPPPRAG